MNTLPRPPLRKRTSVQAGELTHQQFQFALRAEGWHATVDNCCFEHTSRPGVLVDGVYDAGGMIRRRATVSRLHRHLAAWSPT